MKHTHAITSSQRLAALRRMAAAGRIRDLRTDGEAVRRLGCTFLYQAREGKGWSARLTAEGRA